MGRYEIAPGNLNPGRGCFRVAGNGASEGRVGVTTAAGQWQDLHLCADRKAKGGIER